jgi:hypothetical protein
MIYGVRVLLLGLIAVGLYGALSVSYKTVTGTSPCPDVAGIPACFVVLAGYSFMLAASLLQPAKRYKILFLVGWLPVFLLAATGTVFELFNGNTCPKSSAGLALCYVSLALSLIVALLYVFYLKLRGVD